MFLVISSCVYVNTISCLNIYIWYAVKKGDVAYCNVAVMQLQCGVVQFVIMS